MGSDNVTSDLLLGLFASSPQLVVVADDGGHVALKLPTSVPDEEVIQAIH